MYSIIVLDNDDKQVFLVYVFTILFITLEYTLYKRVYCKIACHVVMAAVYYIMFTKSVDCTSFSYALSNNLLLFWTVARCAGL